MFLIGLRVLSQPLLKPFNLSFTAIINWSSLVSILEELDSGESLDLNPLNLISSCVYLCNHKSLYILQFFSQSLVLGLELLAVAAPGSVEF